MCPTSFAVLQFCILRGHVAGQVEAPAHSLYNYEQFRCFGVFVAPLASLLWGTRSADPMRQLRTGRCCCVVMVGGELIVRARWCGRPRRWLVARYTGVATDCMNCCCAGLWLFLARCTVALVLANVLRLRSGPCGDALARLRRFFCSFYWFVRRVNWALK